MLRYSAHAGTVSSICFSPDGRYLASGSTDGRVFLWEPASGEDPRELLLPRAGRERPITSLVFHPDGSLLCMARSIALMAKRRRDAIGYWELPVADSFSAAPHTVGLTPELAFATGTNTLLTHSRRHPRGNYGAEGRVDRWTLPGWTDHHEFATGTDHGHNRIVAHNDRVVTARSINVYLDLWNWESGRRLTTISEPSTRLMGIAIHPVRSSLVIALVDGLREWDWSPREATHRFPLPEGPILWSMAISTDGTRLAIGRKGGRIDLLSGDDWSLISSFPWRIGDVRCVAFAPDGLRCAAGTSRGIVVVWDVE